MRPLNATILMNSLGFTSLLVSLPYNLNQQRDRHGSLSRLGAGLHYCAGSHAARNPHDSTHSCVQSNREKTESLCV